MKQREEYIEIGQVVGTHGIAGELRVQPWADSPTDLIKYKRIYTNKGAAEHTVLSARVHKNIVLVKLKGVDSIEEAELMRGKTLFAARADIKLAPGRHFIQDLIGLAVVDDDTDEQYGVISDVLVLPANDCYSVTMSDGRECLVPVIDDVVRHIDIDNGQVRIFRMKGLFD